MATNTTCTISNFQTIIYIYAYTQVLIRLEELTALHSSTDYTTSTTLETLIQLWIQIT